MTKKDSERQRGHFLVTPERTTSVDLLEGSRQWRIHCVGGGLVGKKGRVGRRGYLDAEYMTTTGCEYECATVRMNLERECRRRTQKTISNGFLKADRAWIMLRSAASAVAGR